MRRISYFGVYADVRKLLCVSIRNLRIYANGERFQKFLRTCADFHILEFVQTFAKSSASALGICASTQVEDIGVSAYRRRFSFLGVSADVRKKSRVSIKNLRVCANGGRLEFLRICADVLVLEFLQTYAKKLRVSISNLRVCENGGRLEFLRICADVLVFEFLQTYAKKLRVSNWNLRMDANGKLL